MFRIQLSDSVVRRLLIVLLLSLLPAAISGQTLPGTGIVPADSTDRFFDFVTTVDRAPQPPVLLDSPVDRTQYRLGPGDVLNVALLGDVNRLHMLTVSPEGAVIVPNVGMIRVLGADVESAERTVREAVRRFYRTVEVSVSLASLRTFKVFVVGNVLSAGVQTATPATRVSELVQLDPNGTIPRNILLRRLDGDTSRVDLARFVRIGDLDANPTVREGDVLTVPVADRFVYVLGSVAFPGRYEFRRGDTLSRLLKLANGGGDLPASAADSIRVERIVSPNERRVFSFAAMEAEGLVGAGFEIEPFDAVYVPRVGNFMERQAATVTGRVARPGTYPIEPGVTTVRELIELAGGLLEDGSLTNAILRRELPAERRDSALSTLNRIPIESLSPAEQRVRRAREVGDPSNVVVDFGLSTTGELLVGMNQTLQAGDVLDVPRHRNEVTVLGAVRQPGIVDFRPGLGIREYVQLAGGYSSRADRRGITILRGRFGAEASPSDIESIEPGDRIIVPFREHMSFTERMQLAGTIASSILGLVVTYITVRDLVDD